MTETSGPTPSGHAQVAALLHARARAHPTPTPRAHTPPRESRAPPPVVELPRPGSEAAGTHLRNNRHVRCLRGAPYVRCVHARRGVRSGEARRLGVLRACASLSIHARPGARSGGGERGTGTHRPRVTTRVRACGRTCVKSPRLARCAPPRSCSSALRDRADHAAAHLETGRDGGGRGEAPSLQLPLALIVRPRSLAAVFFFNNAAHHWRQAQHPSIRNIMAIARQDETSI